MAVTVNLLRILVVCSCFALTVGTCRKDCALCMYRLERASEQPVRSWSCTLECEGGADKQELDMCRNILLEEERMATSSLKGAEGKAEQQHQLTKKFGGFLKRYGDYIMKNSAALEDDTGSHLDAEAKRYGGFMKKDTAAQQESGEAWQLQALREIPRVHVKDSHHGEEDSKHSTVFLRKPQENQEDLVRDLQKRYGGFMRRVGRPEWLDDHKVYGRLTKRFLTETAETSVPYMKKRYGGFMD